MPTERELIVEAIQSASYNYEKTISICKGFHSDYPIAIVCLNINEAPNALLPYITDDYIRSLVIKNSSEEKDIVKENLDLLQEYRDAVTKLLKTDNEQERTDYICNLKDNDMKTQLLKSVKNKKNRKKIIESLESQVTSEIASEVKLVQKMITEFFEDTLGENLTADKREVMEIVFNRTNVILDESLSFEVNAKSYYLPNVIGMNSRNKGNTIEFINKLIHEYGHMFSNFRAKETMYISGYCKKLEEGTQDVFSEMVINHYIEKHGNVLELEDKKVRIHYPFISFSAYDSENALQRTLLYPLEKTGEDKLALSEYQLGDKNKYLEMVVGKEIADEKWRDSFGNPDLTFSEEEIYYAIGDKITEIDTSSVYYQRNSLLPKIYLQNLLDKEKQSSIDLFRRRIYICKDIALTYFKNKKIYEIEPEELEKFIKMVEAIGEGTIIEMNNFADDEFKSLEESELTEKSFEILKNAKVLYSSLENVGEHVEQKLSISITAEQERVKNGQDILETLRKYKEIIPGYKKFLLKNQKKSSNVYLLERIEELQFAYLDQLDRALQEDRTGTIQALTENENTEIWIDKDIGETFDKHGITIQSEPQKKFVNRNTILKMLRKKFFSTRDVIHGAIEGKFTIDEIGGFSILLGSHQKGENDKENGIR